MAGRSPPGRIARLVVLNTAAFHLPPTRRLPRRSAVPQHEARRFPHPRSGLSVDGDRWVLPSDAGRVARATSRPRLAARRLAHLRFVQDIPLRPGPELRPGERGAGALPSSAESPPSSLGEKDFVSTGTSSPSGSGHSPRRSSPVPNAGHLCWRMRRGDPAARPPFLQRHPVSSDHSRENCE